MTNFLLAEVLEAHGGLQRWRDLNGMSSTILTGGRLWGLKGIDLPLSPRIVTTEFYRQWASFTPFGSPDWTMTWTPTRIVIDSATGEVITARDNPRDAFAGHAFDTPWDSLHLAYFNGYAMWTYHALPFILAEPGYEITDLAPITFDGKVLRGLSVRFPERVHTHCRVQRCYFNVDGLLLRHEYDVDVLGGSPAAHLLFNYIEVGGLRLPTRRSVYPLNPDGALQYDLNTVTIAMSNYILR